MNTLVLHGGKASCEYRFADKSQRYALVKSGDTRPFTRTLLTCSIEDFLNNIGAASSAFRLMEVKVMKDVRNRANRLSNCDSFNISRSINAGVEQAEQIRRTLEAKGKAHFPQELRELVQLRVDNPEASLRELGEMLEKPLSKSGVSHKLRRIMEYTE